MINKIIEKARKDDKKVYIYAHKFPDGDAISSSAALAQYLNNNGIDATCVFDNPIFSYSQIIGQISTTKSPEPNSISIIVDTSTVDYAENKAFLSSSPEDIYIIDHHIKNNNCIEDELQLSEENVIRDSSTISTTELLLRLFDEEKITPQIANMLTLGLITDSAKLQFLKVNTLTNLSKLLELGANYEQVLSACNKKGKLREEVGIAKLILNSQKINIGNTFGLVLSIDNQTVNNMASQHSVRNPQKKIYKMNDITNCSFTCICAENTPGEFDLEFRSTPIYGSFNVQELAVKYGGGGHYNASGCHLSQKNGFVQEQMLSLIAQNTSEMYASQATNLSEINLSDTDKELLHVLEQTKKLTTNINPKTLAIIDYLIKQGANYDYTFKTLKSYEKFMLENEILSKIPESTLTQKYPIVSIYLSKQEVNDLCKKYNITQEDILKTIEIFANIDIKFASISFNGRRIQIDKNGKITSRTSSEKNKNLILSKG